MADSSTKVLAWHFTYGMRFRDGQPLVVGKTYTHTGPLVMCDSGYHAGRDITDALYYAPGFTVSRVECSGEMREQSDKLVCRQRKVLWSFDTKKVIIAWARRVATDAVKTVRKTSTDKAWNAWADAWISGKDRTSSSASSASAAAAAAFAASAAVYAERGKYSGWLVAMIERSRHGK